MQDAKPTSIIPRLSDHNLFPILDYWVGAQPDAMLFCFLDSRGNVQERLTYAQFALQVDRLAAYFRETIRGETGARVLLCYQPGLELITALFACNKAGYIGVPALPLSVHQPTAWLYSISHVLDDSQAAGVAMCSTTWKILDACQPGTVSERAVRDRLLELGPLVTTGAAARGRGLPECEPCETFFLQYTSGSTTDPRGVMVSHANLIANAEAVVDHGESIAVSWLPQHHDMGLIGYHINVLLSGGCSYGFAPSSFIRRPALWLETMSRYRATASSITNFALKLCLDERRVPQALLQQLDLGSLRFLMVAAEPVDADSFLAFLDRFSSCGLRRESMFVAYGLAEFTLAVSSYGRRAISIDRAALGLGRVRAAAAGQPAVQIMSCGRLLGDTRMAIVDPDTLLPVADGRTGEVWLAGSSKTQGYWNRPDLTAAVFDARLDPASGCAESFLRTGDVGYVDRGELFICGRTKDMLIVHGRNIYPQDIESEVEKQTSKVRRNSVVAFADEQSGTITVLAELVRVGDVPEAPPVIAAIRERLQVSIANLVFLAPRAIARTSSGKIRRAKTRDLFEHGLLEVISRSRTGAGSVPAGGQDALPDVLESLQQRYGLAGDEGVTLLEAGVDSLDLITLLHWVRDECRAIGAGGLAARITVRLFGSLTVRQIFEAGHILAQTPGLAGERLAGLIGQTMSARLEQEQRQMRADSVYRRPQHAIAAAGVPSAAAGAGDILLTGGTGFFGPFLLSSLLQQFDERIQVLVRGRNREHAAERLRREFREVVGPAAPLAAYDARVNVLCGDLSRPAFGLPEPEWRALLLEVGTIYHSAALVNYLLEYRQMRAANVSGTAQVIDLAFSGRPKVLNHVSTTFVFGWATRDVLYESDRNSAMDHLDFGYSQSKWVAEQLVLSAMDQGLEARIFRPALITPALDGRGSSLDITLRLLAFMIRHGLSVDTGNQVSLMPVEVTADNIAAIARRPDTIMQTFHVTRDRLEIMPRITEIISAQTGIEFAAFPLREFVPEVIRRCTRDDALYPLLDFLVESVDNIAAMEYKLYDNSRYREARDRSPGARQDPPLEDVVAGIIRFLERKDPLPDGDRD